MSEPYDPNPASWAAQGYEGPPPTHPYGAQSSGPAQSYGTASAQPYGPAQPYGTAQPSQTFPPQPYPAQDPAAGGYPSPYGAPNYSMYPDPGAASRGRPGQVIAASVLGYLEAALLVLTALILVSASSVTAENSDRGGIQTDGWGIEFAYAGIGDFMAAALLIAGGVVFTLGKRAGRTMVLGALVLCVIEAVFWIVRLNYDAGLIAPGAVFYLILPIIGTSLSFASSVSRWLAVVSPKRTTAAPPH